MHSTLIKTSIVNAMVRDQVRTIATRRRTGPVRLCRCPVQCLGSEHRQQQEQRRKERREEQRENRLRQEMRADKLHQERREDQLRQEQRDDRLHQEQRDDKLRQEEWRREQWRWLVGGLAALLGPFVDVFREYTRNKVKKVLAEDDEV